MLKRADHMETITYGKAHTSEFLAIAELDRSSWGEAKEEKFIPDGEHAWRLWVEYGLVYVARDESSQIVGVGLAFPCLAEKFNKLLAVHKLFVMPSYRGNSIGTKLFELITQYCDEYGYGAFLTVNPQNRNAIAIYESLGFETGEEIKGYYREYEDRFVMVRAPKRAES